MLADVPVHSGNASAWQGIPCLTSTTVGSFASHPDVTPVTLDHFAEWGEQAYGSMKRNSFVLSIDSRKTTVTPTSTATALGTQEAPEPARSRPRVEGDREREILEAALETLADVGYDRLNFDAVASAAKASKATLYRRWPGKVDLVIDALQLMIGVEADRYPDTGSLRGDLIAQACAKGGIGEDLPVQVFAALLGSLHRDPELREAIMTRLMAPKMAVTLKTFRAAQLRGEIGNGADLEMLARLLPAICIHEAMLTGTNPSQERLISLVDSVVLPACAATLQRG